MQPTAVATSAPPPTVEPAPVLDASGQDYGAVWRSINDYRTWLFRNPDPAGLDAIFLPACPCHAEDAALLTEYAGQGLRWTGVAPTVTGVAVLDDIDPNLVTLRTTTVRAGGTELVDAAGAVHESLPPLAPTHIDVVLQREDPAAPWKVRDLANQGPASGAPS